MSRRFTIVFALGSCLALVIGCATTGLSPREVRGQDFSTYAMALYDLPGSGTAATARTPLHLPARVAVAQVGEVAPPQVVIETFRSEAALFASVQPVPGVVDVGAQVAYSSHAPDYQVQARRTAHSHIDRMRSYSRDIGAEYLFLFGGTIDRASTRTPLSAADLTIVGGFFVPSRKIQGTARASGALVDVETGRVILSVSADSQSKRMAPSFSQDNDEIELLSGLRDDVVLELAEQLTASMKSRVSAGG